jgi:DNA-binding transcriptional ArsR family regulator
MTQDGQDADRLWAALGDPTRLRLLDLLLQRGEATASALATEFPITRQGIAKHLLVLQRADLVHAQRAGREARFTIRDERLAQAQQQMAQVASRWDERLTRIKRLAEAAHNASRAANSEEEMEATSSEIPHREQRRTPPHDRS